MPNIGILQAEFCSPLRTPFPQKNNLIKFVSFVKCYIRYQYVVVNSKAMFYRYIILMLNQFLIIIQISLDGKIFLFDTKMDIVSFSFLEFRSINNRYKYK